MIQHKSSSVDLFFWLLMQINFTSQGEAAVYGKEEEVTTNGSRHLVIGNQFHPKAVAKEGFPGISLQDMLTGIGKGAAEYPMTTITKEMTRRS